MGRRFAFFLAFIAAAPLSSAAFDVSLKSETIISRFERDTAKGEAIDVMPVYEYLKLDMGDLDGEGFSFHSHGWGRRDFEYSEYYDKNSQGEILYGYLQYNTIPANINVQIGRQYIFTGVSDESIDGVRAGGDLGKLFSANAYVGQPVSFETSNGKTGDLIYGGRLSHRFGALYELGLSYKLINNDSEKQSQELGIDSFLSLWSLGSISGWSRRDMETDSWAEHSYGGRISVSNFVFRPFFERFQYEGFFNAAAESKPFVFLSESDETMTSAGGILLWDIGGFLDLELKIKSTDYAKRDGEALYYSGRATLKALSLPNNVIAETGAEGGRMQGDGKEDRYSLGRFFVHMERGRLFVDGDFIYVDYDEEIMGEDRALFASLGAGTRLLEDRLKLTLSGDYGADPYFDSNIRAILSLTYLWDKTWL